MIKDMKISTSIPLIRMKRESNSKRELMIKQSKETKNAPPVSRKN